MAKQELDEIGPWSLAKLDILRAYATEYTKIMASHRKIRRFLYADAFAGTGKHISRQTGQFVPGSPTNALNVVPPFSEYHFVDLDQTRVDFLEDLAKGQSNVHVYHGDCNAVLLKEVFPRCCYSDYARGLCLLDPYSLAVDWKVLATAGSMKTIEVFYNFMIMDANMNMLLKDPDKARPAEVERMNVVWGDDSWRSAAYRTNKTLFEDEEEKRSNEAIAEAFRVRLQKVAGFDYVPEPVAMKNSTGAVVYYLYFASPNRTGARIVEHIFRNHGR